MTVGGFPKTPSLSTQQLLDCVGPNDFCGGGYPPDALEYLANPAVPGLLEEADYNYTAVKGRKCRLNELVGTPLVCETPP